MWIDTIPSPVLSEWIPAGLAAESNSSVLERPASPEGIHSDGIFLLWRSGLSPPFPDPPEPQDDSTLVSSHEAVYLPFCNPGTVQVGRDHRNG